MENDAEIEQKIVQILEPFFKYIKDFEKRTGLGIVSTEPLRNYGLDGLYGKNIIDLYNMYLELTFVRNVTNNNDFGDTISGNEPIKEDPGAGQSS